MKKKLNIQERKSTIIMMGCYAKARFGKSLVALGFKKLGYGMMLSAVSKTIDICMLHSKYDKLNNLVKAHTRIYELRARA